MTNVSPGFPHQNADTVSGRLTAYARNTDYILNYIQSAHFIIREISKRGLKLEKDGVISLETANVKVWFI